MPFSAHILTLFPEMFPGPLGLSLAGKALKEGAWSLEATDIRDFATDKHRTVDRPPYGGGAGMVMRADVLDAAIQSAKAKGPEAVLLCPSPRGQILSQSLVRQVSRGSAIILCGRFEAIDERIYDTHRPIEFSVGNCVLSGGEIAAMALLDACVRLLPGVMGEEESMQEESFGEATDYAGLLEYPHYTRPPLWNGLAVPAILQSGNHAEIKAWRLAQAQEITQARRPDVWDARAARTARAQETR